MHDAVQEPEESVPKWEMVQPASQKEPDKEFPKKRLISCRGTADRVWEQKGTFTMQTAQLTPTHPASTGGTPGAYGHHKTPVGPLPELAAWKVPNKSHTQDIDPLISLGFPDKNAAPRKATPLPGTAAEAMIDATPGIFLGLRLALLFNAGLGVAALVIYEGWTMLAR